MLPVLVSAQIITIENPLIDKTFGDMINRIINILLYISFGIAPIMIIVAGFYFVTAMGDEAKIKKAKQIILWTLIGLGIILCSKGIIVFFNVAFGVTKPPTT